LEFQQISLTKKGNFLVSPLSAKTVLALLQSGCKDETAQELRTVLQLPEDKETVESAIKSLLPKLKGNDLYTLHTANKMYVKKNFSIKEGFKKAAAQVYYADTDTIDFTQSVQAAKTMNSWVEKHTNDKIHNLIDSNLLDEGTRAVLINALYFKANWSSPFPLASTRNINFYKTATDIVQVDALKMEYLNVILPKFRIETSINFKNILKNVRHKLLNCIE
jgi:serpin B